MVNKNKKVIVAMSGGLDSSAAAFLLQEAGYEVSGVFMRLGKNYQDAEMSARNVCKQLKIKFYPVNIHDAFKREVIKYFLDSYEKGETPNPCVRCNRQIKFGELLRYREKLGADFLASGHYIQRLYNPDTEKFELYKAKDKNKDQSYFIYNLGQKELKHLLFPLGDKKKKDMREMMKDEKIDFIESESMDICFLYDDGKVTSQNQYLKDKIKFSPGEILEVSEEQDGKRSKKVIGEHKGLPFYTLGQRRGVEIGGTGPYYVVATDYKKNQLLVSKKFDDDMLMRGYLYSGENSFVSGDFPDKTNLESVIRYRHKAVACKINRVDNSRIKTVFKNKQRAVTIGQSVVWYDGERLIGGGVISK